MTCGEEEDGALDAAIGEMLRRAWGEDVRATEREGLAARNAPVLRLRLEGRRAPPTVIVKHVRPEQFPLTAAAGNPEFLEELAASRFLRLLDAEAGLKPALIDADPRGLMLIEDLGRENYARPRSYGELIPLVAGALARLHAGTAGHAALHEACRREAGLDGEDRRSYGVVVLARRTAKAARTLSERGGAAVAEALAEAGARMAAPGCFAGLLHDDLANARQTFEVGDALYLLDFENAKFGHSLLDLGKPMIGKFESDAQTGAYVWACPGFPIALADAYRRARTGLCVDDATWRRTLGAALIHTALALLGRLTEFVGNRPLYGPVTWNANGILARLAALLTELDVYHPIAALSHTALPWPNEHGL